MNAYVIGGCKRNRIKYYEKEQKKMPINGKELTKCFTIRLLKMLHISYYNFINCLIQFNI